MNVKTYLHIRIYMYLLDLTLKGLLSNRSNFCLALLDVLILPPPPGRVYPMGLIRWWAHRHNDMGKCLSSRHWIPSHPRLTSKPHKMNLRPGVLLGTGVSCDPTPGSAATLPVPGVSCDPTHKNSMEGSTFFTFTKGQLRPYLTSV